MCHTFQNLSISLISRTCAVSLRLPGSVLIASSSTLSRRACIIPLHPGLGRWLSYGTSRDLLEDDNLLSSPAMKLCATYVTVIILPCCFNMFTYAHISHVFRAWLGPQHTLFVDGSDCVTEGRHVKGFLDEEMRKGLGDFLDYWTERDHKRGQLLAGVLSTARRLINADNNNNTISGELLDLSKQLGRLPINFVNWPLVRRLVVASLALRQDRHGPFAQEIYAKGLLLQLFAQHKGSARRKAMIEFAHVSKSAGTSFCNLAVDNGCQSDTKRNCLVDAFGDDPRYFDQSYHEVLRGNCNTSCDNIEKSMRSRVLVSCETRRKWLQSSAQNAYANEYTALGGIKSPALAHPCRNMLTVLQLRHPYARVISHMKFAWLIYVLRCGERDARAVYLKHSNRTDVWSALMPAPTNNYLIRSLLGEVVFNMPPGGISSEHLDIARDLLAKQYDVLLVLEDTDLSKIALQYGLGFQRLKARHDNKTPKGTEESLPKDLEQLYELNKLDLQLYQFGVLMARLDAIVYDAASRLVKSGFTVTPSPSSPPPPHRPGCFPCDMSKPHCRDEEADGDRKCGWIGGR
ncbi:hypothetical protein VaNZ11_006029 [Volvox africanus]|uniref:Uncharacterized protein n=1 Tax=Volvox africanus TaxID=51714 RepID=A0ABQ5RZR3_9CHLO|nr:hypothetical protein VaNZ11_006029 [Volvox africanus]